ncbi:MAG: hypothetical protein ACOCPU_00945 [Methanohalophilus sp.]
MKYTFQDSTDLPVQRDFIEDLKNFVYACSKVLPVEKEAIEKNEIYRKSTYSLEKALEELNSSNGKVVECVKSLDSDFAGHYLDEYKRSVLDACDRAAHEGLEQVNLSLEKERNDYNKLMNSVGSQVLSMLNPLFEGGIYGSHESYSMEAENGQLTGKKISTLGSMQSFFELGYNRSSVAIKDLIDTLFIPTWTRAGFISKEKKIKMEDLSEYLLKSFEYDGNEHVEASFSNKKTDHSLKIISDGDEYSVIFDDTDITADPALFKSITLEEIDSLVKNLVEFARSNIASRKLVNLMSGDENAIYSNEIFDCLKTVAEQYSDIITQCRERGYVKGEITIKIEQEDGTRTEKYVDRSEIFNRLSELGSEGLEIAGILGVESFKNNSH